MRMFQAAALVVALGAASAVIRDARAEGSAAAIRAADVDADVRYLASPELEGRGALTGGLARAGEYVARRLAAAGLAPAGEQGSFFQTVEIPLGRRAGPGTRLSLGGVPLVLGEGFSPNLRSATASGSGGLAFAGYCVAEPERYDDFAGIDVRGKIVICLRYAPGYDERSGGILDPAVREAASLRRKLENAVARGAAGLLVVDPDDPAASPLPVGRPFGPTAIASFHVGAEAVDRLLRLLRLPQGAQVGPAGEPSTLAGLRARIQATGRPASFDLPAYADFAVEWERPGVRGRNVVAVLEGSDPALRDEAVLIGAHYDHLGRGDEGSALDGRAIHPGADDNASGTAALLEIAESFAAETPRARRSIVFAAFTAEEKGLVGSVAVAAHPARRVVAMLNLDMVGRLRDGALEVGGATTASEWRDIVNRANTERLALTFPERLVPNSDHAPFVAHHVPSLFMFTGMHRDYHRASDTPDKVNAEGVAAVARLAARVVRDVADRPGRLAFVEPQWTRGGVFGAARVPSAADATAGDAP